MKKEKNFEQVKILIILLFTFLCFSYIRGNLKIAIFLVFSGFISILACFYINEEKLNLSKSIYKFILSFFNITSLFYLLGYFLEFRYFDEIIKKIYIPFFEKGINTNLYIGLIFIFTSLVLIKFDRLNLGEKDGE